MEYLDVLDEEGNLTGYKKLRTDVHNNEDWHRLVFVWVINSQGELLIQKRSSTKDANPGKWDVACGGHVIAGDNSLLTAVKEMEEELGINVLEKSLEFLFNAKEIQKFDGNKIHKCHADVYLFKSDMKISDLILQKEEVDEVKFIPWKEVEEMILKQDETFAPRSYQYNEFFKLLHKRFDSA
jgi:isopentenyldiphosphate isomerase